MKSTRYYCQILKKLKFSVQIFEKYPNIKFHENPSSASPVVPRGRVDRRTDGRTDMTKPTVAFHNFAHAPKNMSGSKRPDRLWGPFSRLFNGK